MAKKLLQIIENIGKGIKDTAIELVRHPLRTAVLGALVLGANSPTFANRNIIRDYGAEITPEISEVQAWEEKLWPANSPFNKTEINPHSQEEAYSGTYSLNINTDRTPEMDNFDFAGSLIQKLPILIPIDQIDSLSFYTLLKYPNNNFANMDYFSFIITSEERDTLAYSWHHPDCPMGNDSPKQKIIKEVLEDENGEWVERKLTPYKDWIQKGLDGNAKINYFEFYVFGETVGSHLYAVNFYGDDVTLIPNKPLTVNISLDSTEVKNGYLVVYGSNQGTDNIEENIGVRARLGSSFDETRQVSGLASGESFEVSYSLAELVPGSYDGYVTSGGLENITLDQCSIDDRVKLEKVNVGISEQPVVVETNHGQESIVLGGNNKLLNYNFNTPGTISIYEGTSGRRVLSENVYGSGEINLSELPAGVYVQIDKQEGQQHQEKRKIVVVK